MPTVDPSIFKKNFTTTPQIISADVLALCHEINPAYTPVWVPTYPDQNARVGECFANVGEKVQREGGAIVYGWAIWEWKRVFVEAEHHAVWEKDKTKIDITPHTNGEEKILFLPDPDRIYDYNENKRLPNVKRSLDEISSVAEWIHATDRYHKFIEEHSIGNQIHYTQKELYPYTSDVMNTWAMVLVDLARKTKVNDRCFCCSGKKFKKCCAPLINLYG